MLCLLKRTCLFVTLKTSYKTSKLFFTNQLLKMPKIVPKRPNFLEVNSMVRQEMLLN